MKSKDLKDLKIIKMWEYHQRIIFLTEINNKFQLFYKSSGLAGHGSKGMVMPHMLLKANKDSSPDGLGEWMSFGWIPKYFIYNGRFQEYRAKARSEFPSVMHPFMDHLETVDTSKAELEPDPRVINNFCIDYITEQGDYLDWKECESVS